MSKDKVRELLELEKELGPGFHGIITRPDGKEGYLSIVETAGGESISWFLIGEGQDEIEVMKVARALHTIYDIPSTIKIDADYISALGEVAEGLAKPKEM